MLWKGLENKIRRATSGVRTSIQSVYEGEARQEEKLEMGKKMKFGEGEGVVVTLGHCKILECVPKGKRKLTRARG